MQNAIATWLIVNVKYLIFNSNILEFACAEKKWFEDFCSGWNELKIRQKYNCRFLKFSFLVNRVRLQTLS